MKHFIYHFTTKTDESAENYNIKKLERISKGDRNARKKLIEERAYEIWVGIKATYNSPNRNDKARDWKRLTNLRQNT